MDSRITFFRSWSFGSQRSMMSPSRMIFESGEKPMSIVEDGAPSFLYVTPVTFFGNVFIQERNSQNRSLWDPISPPRWMSETTMMLSSSGAAGGEIKVWGSRSNAAWAYCPGV